MIVRLQYLALAAFLVCGPAQAQAEETARACRPEASGTLVCGPETRAIRIIRGSNSPSGRLGIGWRPVEGSEAAIETREDDGGQVLAAGEAENLLVDLASGTVVKVLSGTHFGDNPDINHARARAMWSADERFLIEALSGKWSLEVLSLHAIDVDGEVVRASAAKDLLPLVRAAAHGLLKAKRRHANADDYVLDTIVDGLPGVDGDGTLALPVIQQIPKTDIAEAALITLKVGGSSRAADAAVVSAVPTAMPD